MQTLTSTARAASRPREAECDVVIVEDDPIIREQLAEALTDAGMSVETAPDGQAALEVLEQTSPAVVITDLIMPGMNGWQLAEEVRARPRLDAVLVLFVTAVGNAHRVPPGPVFLKPLDLESLIRAVQNHVGHAEA
jgi:CheY-like chemotaxis protein